MKVIAVTLLSATLVTPAWAQIIPGGNICGDTELDPCFVQDYSTTDNTALILADEDQELLPGLAGGFDVSQALSGDLEQQVSSAGGMPLIIQNLTQFPQYWPGYGNASYVQNPQPGSPEANMAVALGTLQGALNAGADQQASQATENQRLQDLENAAGAAIGNLQVEEVGNEIALFQAQQDMKLRNALNGTLNAQLIVQSNRESEKAQNQLEAMGIAGEHADWDLTNEPAEEIPPPSTWSGQ